MDFLRYYFLEDISVCDRLIELHKNSEEKTPGYCYDPVTGGSEINADIKDSIDLELYPYEEDYKDGKVMPEAVWDYLGELQKVCELYVKEFPTVDWYGRWSIIEPFNIQYYQPGGGFKVFHTERVGIENLKRHLVWMTYLNDVDDQGETEFYYQGYKIKPEKGKTVIWPTDWTYTHRGIPSPTQEKYIITGWYNFW